MGTKTLYVIAIVAFAMTALLGTQGRAQQKMGMQGMMKGQSMQQMMGQMDDSRCAMMNGGHMQGFFLNQAKDLGLNESQIAQLQKIKTATQKAVIQKEADLKIANLELNEIMKDSNAKRSDLENRAKKVEDLRSAIRLTKFKAQLDARAVLTPEQLQKAKSMKMHGMNGGMMQMGSQGKDGGCSMTGSNAKNNDGTSEHEKHHPKSEK